MIKKELCAALSFLTLHLEASAYWDFASIQSVDDVCSLSEVQVDESKLSIRLKEFKLDSNDIQVAGDKAIAECGSRATFVIPAKNRLSSLTHRVIARAAKDEHVELRMHVAVESLFNRYEFRGVLPFGTIFDDRVLLYKSFDARNLVGCSDSEQKVSMKFTWTLEILKRELARLGRISMESEDSVTDTWLTTEVCHSAGTLAR